MADKPTWTCRWCGHITVTAQSASYCTGCWNGRTQAIEDMVKDKNGLPRKRLVPKKGIASI